MRDFDFAIAARMFEGTVQTVVDDRHHYGEARFMPRAMSTPSSVMHFQNTGDALLEVKNARG